MSGENDDAPVLDSQRRSVLVVDDEATFRERLGKAFADRGFDVMLAPDGATALALAQADSPEYAVVDLRMPGPSGLEVVRGLHALDVTTKIVVLTGYGSIATALEAVRSGAVHYLTKPADLDEILAAFSLGEDSPPVASSETATPTTVPSLARVEWEHIERVLVSCQGNITQAAKLLGIHRRSLQRKLSKFPVRR